jgi:hypothetical protein
MGEKINPCGLECVSIEAMTKNLALTAIVPKIAPDAPTLGDTAKAKLPPSTFLQLFQYGPGEHLMPG